MTPRRRRSGSGLVSRRGAVAGLATGLLGVGGATYLERSGAFESVTGARGVSLGAVGDSDAVLGITGLNDTSVTPTFTNNGEHDMDLTLDSPDDVEFDVGDNGSWSAPPVSFSLGAGVSEEVNVRFSGECTDAGTATIDADSVLRDDSGDSIGSISLSRAVEISEAGQLQFNGEARSAGASGRYEFDIENTGCEDITFTGIGINETTTDAEYVSGDGSLYNKDTGQELVTDRIPIDSTDPENDTRRDLDPTLSLAQNELVTLEFELFRRSGILNPNVDMRGEDVRITLYLSDGSSTTLELCLGSCDF